MRVGIILILSKLSQILDSEKQNRKSLKRTKNARTMQRSIQRIGERKRHTCGRKGETSLNESRLE